MQTLSEIDEHAASLYWLAHLLTGRVGDSLDVATEAIYLQDEATFFSDWMLRWSRRVVIAKALSAIRGELALSARRLASQRGRGSATPRRNWSLDAGATRVQLERALLAIDVFPRCAVVLSVFEGMSVDDVAILLDADRELVRKAQATGLRELTRNLAAMQVGTSAAALPYVITTEMQNA